MAWRNFQNLQHFDMNTNLFPLQYDRITALLEPYGAYLVGGAVRDLLLGQPVHDLDFALPDQTLEAGKKLADQLGGAIFTLDENRSTVRVILDGGEHSRLVIDLTCFQGASIEEDLAARDFTITSLALRPGARDPVIDPFQGAQDLKDGLIRPTSKHALQDDPLRCLRAVRLAAQLDFKILPETSNQIRIYLHLLSGVSRERIRDELFRILEGPRQAAAMLSLKALGLYQYVLPGEFTSENSRRLRNLERIWSLFLEPHDQDRAGDWFRGLLVHRLGRYRKQIQKLLAWEPVPGRSLHQLSLLLVLLAQVNGEKTSGEINQLSEIIPLSNQELTVLEVGFASAEDFLELSGRELQPQPLDIYRYYRRRGRPALLGVFLGLAEGFGKQGLDRDQWVILLETARVLLEGYWECYDQWVDPPALVDGNQIIEEFELQPGPLIGELLELLKEEQVLKDLESTDSALDFLKNQLADWDGSGS